MTETSQEVKAASAAQFGLRTLVVGAVAIVNCALLLGKPLLLVEILIPPRLMVHLWSIPTDPLSLSL